MEQYPLGRVDPQPLKQLGVAQRQLDHLTQRVDCVLHPAQIVVRNVGAPLAILLGKFRQQLDDRRRLDMNDPAWHGAHDPQPNLL